MNWIRHDFDDDDLTPSTPTKRTRRGVSRRANQYGNSYSSPIRGKTPVKSLINKQSGVPNVVNLNNSKEIFKNLTDLDFDASALIVEEDDDEFLATLSLPTGELSASKRIKREPKQMTSSAPQLRMTSTKQTLSSTNAQKLMPWTERHCPTSLSQLHSVHAKKLQEVRQWFETLYRFNDTNDSKNRLLLVSGPAGCGKTMAIRLIAKEIGIQVYEPIVASASANVSVDLGEIDFTSQLQRFRQFLLGTNNSMDGNPAFKLILIKDLPQSITTHTEAYRDFLINYLTCLRNPVPIVFVFTLEFGSNKLRDRLFPKVNDCTKLLNFNSIEFNSVAKSAMAKVLNAITNKQVPKLMLDSLIESCDGDVRNAINVLEFSMPSEFQSKTGSTKSKSTSTKDFTFCLGGKDSAPMFFHFLGKILYCKRNPLLSFDGSVEQLPTHLSHHQRHPLKENPDQLLDQLSDVSDNLMLFLQQNYCHFMQGDIHAASRCIGWLSAADESFSSRNSWCTPALGEYGRSISLRGIMFNVPTNKGGHSFYTFQKPRYFEQTRRVQDIEQSTAAWRAMHNPTNGATYRLLLEDLPFMVHLKRNISHTKPFTSQLSRIYTDCGSAPVAILNDPKAKNGFSALLHESLHSKELLLIPDFYEINPIIEDD